MSSWWRHYGMESQAPRHSNLYVLVVFDRAGLPIGIAPWYCRPSTSQGRVLRFLGVREVCGDYLSVLSQPGREEAVAAAMAEWLAEAGRCEGLSQASEADRWDLLALAGLDAEDTAMTYFADEMAARGHSVHRRNGPNTWRIELPATWDGYLAMLSKSHRKQLRRIQRNLLDTGRVTVHRVETAEELAPAQQILVDLHQKRRQSVGDSGCFVSSPYETFHREVMMRMLPAGHLMLSWVELDGRPVASEYHLQGGKVVYAYQSGVAPDALKHSPGQISNMIAIRRAVSEGRRVFDFLRGDEPYKAHWRAKPRPTLEIRIAADRAAARFRHGLWLAGSNVKAWLKNSLPMSVVEP